MNQHHYHLISFEIFRDIVFIFLIVVICLALCVACANIRASLRGQREASELRTQKLLYQHELRKAAMEELSDTQEQQRLIFGYDLHGNIIPWPVDQHSDEHTDDRV